MTSINGNSEKKVLLVEDNHNEETLIKRALFSLNPKLKIEVARDGCEALEYIFSDKEFKIINKIDIPDLVILDIKLPKVNGMEVLKAIRSCRLLDMLPIVMFTSSDEEKEIIDSYRLGANSYVEKPIDYKKFNDVISGLENYWLHINRTI